MAEYVAGVGVDWFTGALPSEVEKIGATPFALAFVAGFSIDILFATLERIVAAFETTPRPA